LIVEKRKFYTLNSGCYKSNPLNRNLAPEIQEEASKKTRLVHRLSTSFLSWLWLCKLNLGTGLLWLSDAWDRSMQFLRFSWTCGLGPTHTSDAPLWSCWLMLITLSSLGLTTNPLNRSVDTHLMKVLPTLILTDLKELEVAKWAGARGKNNEKR
jgi:hypothetical protein